MQKHSTPIELCDNLSQLLADPELHVVDITTYPSQHKKAAIAAARVGKKNLLRSVG